MFIGYFSIHKTNLNSCQIGNSEECASTCQYFGGTAQCDRSKLRWVREIGTQKQTAHTLTHSLVLDNNEETCIIIYYASGSAHFRFKEKRITQKLSGKDLRCSRCRCVYEVESLNATRSTIFINFLINPGQNIYVLIAWQHKWHPIYLIANMHLRHKQNAVRRKHKHMPTTGANEITVRQQCRANIWTFGYWNIYLCLRTRTYALPRLCVTAQTKSLTNIMPKLHLIDPTAIDVCSVHTQHTAYLLLLNALGPSYLDKW